MKLAPSVPFFLLFSWFVFVSAASTIDLDAVGQYRCTLDEDVCDWAIQGPITHGGNAACDHGWPPDAVQGVTDNGMYACFYLEGLPPGTNRSRLTSPTINTTHQVVMSFAIGTVRPPTGTYLNVILVNETGTETLLCSTSDVLLPWQNLYVGVVQPGPFRIVIEGIPDPPFYPNFGIDDLTLTAVENATANVDVQTTNCSTELLTTVPMTTWQYNTTRPMTSGQVHTTTPMALSQDTTTRPHNTTLPMTISQFVDTTTPTASSQDATTRQYSTTRAITSGQVDTTTHAVGSQDTTTRQQNATLPMTSGHVDTTTPTVGSQDTTTRQHNATLPMTSSQVDTTSPMGLSQDTTAFSQTSGQQVATLPSATSRDTPTVPATSIQGTSNFLSTVKAEVATGCLCANTCPPVGTGYPHMATSSPDGDPVVASSRSSSGVDPAVCAGIAIATAAVGVVVGVLATLLVHRLRNRKEASEVYEDVNGTAGTMQAPSNPLYGIPMDSLPAGQES